MKFRKRPCIAGVAGVLVASALLLAAFYLFAPTSLKARVSAMASVAYAKLFVKAPQGLDAHRFYVNSGYTSPNAYIAHGAGILGYALNNSVEAAEDSLRRGFKYIEFDLQTSTDGHLVAAHSWRELREAAGLPASDAPMSLHEVREIAKPGAFSPATAQDICRLLEENKDLFVVTDRVDDYELLLREIPYPDRLIVEVVGGMEAYERAIRAGVRYPSLSVSTVYLLDIAYRADIPIISLKDSDFFSSPEGEEMVRRVHEKGIAILLFSYSGNAYWEKPDFIKAHLGKTFSMIYADSWGPRDLPSSDNVEKDHE